MVGKIVRIKDEFDTKYIKIKEESEDLYVGYGFVITNTELCFMSNYISESVTVDKGLQPQFEIIDEVTFNRSFDQMINSMRYKHMQEML